MPVDKVVEIIQIGFPNMTPKAHQRTSIEATLTLITRALKLYQE